MTTIPQAPARTYRVRTYGCQMNVHDSERLSGLLEAAGYTAAPEDGDADVVVLNTCAVRENADNRLYGNLGHLRPVAAGTRSGAGRTVGTGVSESVDITAQGYGGRRGARESRGPKITVRSRLDVSRLPT